MTGRELQRLRKQAGLSQTDLARRADLTVRTIGRWELGEVPIPRIAALGLRVLLAKAGKDRR